MRNWESERSVWFPLLVLPSCFTFVLNKVLRSRRDGVSQQEMESQVDFHKSTAALISDKDRELETLRNEVLLGEQLFISGCCFLKKSVKELRVFFFPRRRSRCYEGKTPWPRPCSRRWRPWRGTRLSCRAASTVWSRGSWVRGPRRTTPEPRPPQVRRPPSEAGSV